MIREFIPADQAKVIGLQEQFMVEFFPEFANDARRFEWNADAYAIDEHYLKKGGKAWVVEADADIVAFGCLRRVDSSTAEIKRIRVQDRQRGKGIGKSIVQQIEDYCITSAITRVLVDTDDRFAAARSMYSNMGYIVYRSETEVKDGREYTDHYFEKMLRQT